MRLSVLDRLDRSESNCGCGLDIAASWGIGGRALLGAAGADSVMAACMPETSRRALRSLFCAFYMPRFTDSSEHGGVAGSAGGDVRRPEEKQGSYTFIERRRMKAWVHYLSAIGACALRRGNTVIEILWQGDARRACI